MKKLIPLLIVGAVGLGACSTASKPPTSSNFTDVTSIPNGWTKAQIEVLYTQGVANGLPHAYNVCQDAWIVANYTPRDFLTADVHLMLAPITAQCGTYPG